MIIPSFEDFLTEESQAAEEAKRRGLTSAGFGLWRDKQGKVVARTVDGKLEPVKGSRADLSHYHINVPQNKEVDHDSIDSVMDAVQKYATPGTKVDTDVTKYGTHKTSAIHPDKAKHLHDDLIEAGFEYEKDPDWGDHTYRKGNTAITISAKPDTSHKPGAKNDHHSIVVSVDHVRVKKKK